MDGVLIILLAAKHPKSQVDGFKLDAFRSKVSYRLQGLPNWLDIQHILHSQGRQIADADCN